MRYKIQFGKIKQDPKGQYATMEEASKALKERNDNVEKRAADAAAAWNKNNAHAAKDSVDSDLSYAERMLKDTEDMYKNDKAHRKTETAWLKDIAYWRKRVDDLKKKKQETK